MARREACKHAIARNYGTIIALGHASPIMDQFLPRVFHGRRVRPCDSPRRVERAGSWREFRCKRGKEGNKNDWKVEDRALVAANDGC